MLYEIFTNVDDTLLGPQFARTISAEKATRLLNERFATYFSDTTVRVSADDSIVADAAAGNDYVKVRTGGWGWCAAGRTPPAQRALKTGFRFCV